MKNVTLNTIKINSKASSILDLLRFLSALTVFLFHFYVPLPGYQAVMIFFVLSGFFISSTVLKSIKNNRWSWSEYLLKRITRLWIVLLPCLFLTFVWAKLQINLFGTDQKITNYLDLKKLVGNIFFLQGISVKVYGLNGPLWSLSYEFWYYILFPCIALVIFSRRLIVKFLYTLIFITISIFVGEKIMLYFLVWILGALIPFIKPFKFKRQYLNYTFFTVSIVIAICSLNYQAGSSFFSDFLVGVTFSIVIYIITSLFNNSYNTKFNINKELASFSYTLYLTHYPLANFILTWLGSPKWPFAKTTIIIKVVLATLVLSYAWIIALLTEKQTDKIRKLIFYTNYRSRSKKIENPY